MYEKKFKYSEKLRNIYENLFVIVYKLFMRKDYSLGGELRSVSDNGMYVNCINTLIKNEKSFYYFKRHPIYRSILVHITFSEGQKYIDKIILTKNIDLSKKININSLMITVIL